MLARLKGPVTLVVLLGLVAAALVYGIQLATESFPSFTTTTDDAACVRQSVEKGDKLKSSQITVNVYNAGTVAGRAEQTQEELVQKGFIPGTTGNAPEGTRARGTVILDPDRRSPSVRLVKKQLKGKVKVRKVEEDLSEGVDIVVGDRAKGVRNKAKVSIKVAKTTEVCLPAPTTS